MSKPYDAVTKRLLELRPEDWVSFLRLPPGLVSLVDADLSTVSVYADRLIHVDAEAPYLLHTELESGKDSAAMPRRLFHYNASAFYKFDLPVVSTVFLLRKEANSPRLTGLLEIPGPDGRPYLTFEYGVVRVWQMDIEQTLSGGLSLLPFAPISDVPVEEMPRVIRRMDERIGAESRSEQEASELWAATEILMGLRYNEAFTGHVLQGISQMRESVTYQRILNEGRVVGQAEGQLQEARRMVVRAGLKRLGLVTPENEARINAVASLNVLEALLDRVFDVETWEDLLYDLPQ